MTAAVPVPTGPAGTGPAGMGPAGMGPGEPLLTARGVSVSFPVGSPLAARFRHEERLLRAVDGVDLDIGRGQALGLVGESGSGKPWRWPGCARLTVARSASAGKSSGPTARGPISAGSRWCSRIHIRR